MTIHGYLNTSFFVPANNPHGHCVWYASRAQRDAAVDALETEATKAGLSDPTFARIDQRIRTEAQREWFYKLSEREGVILYANGIDGPTDAPSHEWGITEWTPATMGRKGGSAKTPAKTAAARQNGRKGGRPAKRWLAFTTNGGYDGVLLMAGQTVVSAWYPATREDVLAYVRDGQKAQDWDGEMPPDGTRLEDYGDLVGRNGELPEERRRFWDIS